LRVLDLQASEMIAVSEAARELLDRRKARRELVEYIHYTSPAYIRSWFSDTVCAALDRFIEDVQAGKRPILVLQAPPQHGKSEIVSRKLPAYLLGRFPSWRIGAASYSDELANTMAQDVRRGLASPEHQRLFPAPAAKDRYSISRIGEFTAPGGRGSYLSVGVGSGLTGRPLDIGIIDDPTKDASAALSETVKEGQWSWYQSVFTTRLSEQSGQVVMATSWAQDDLVGRILEQYRGNPRLTHLRFPAINSPEETGYDPLLPAGALCPELRTLDFLLEQKALSSDYWWAALYQQNPQPLGGNVFKHEGLHFYAPKDRPQKFDKVICSWDCTFKDTDGTDFVVGQAWGKLGANAYLLDQMRARMSFSETVKNVIELRHRWPQTTEILIEDKANGPAVIDVLKAQVPGLIAIEPDGSKLARAHAVTWVWEAGNVLIPYEQIVPWVRGYITEITMFPAAAHDDQVDAMTQALRRLYPLFGQLKISQAAIDKALGRQ
jgi:predicted phage terminase large subunit-like protein